MNYRKVMEKHLGRELIKGEVVHHIDKNRKNNDIDNLILFSTKEAHARFHFEEGDLKGIAGANKKVLINGKLMCSRCKKFKEVKDFITESAAHLGVKGVCRKCYKGGRRKS